MAKVAKALSVCPCCGGKLHVSEYACKECGITVRGEFAEPAFAELSAEDQHFVAVFMRNSGNMRDVQTELKLSYPTVRKMLDRVAAAFGAQPDGKKKAADERDTIERLRSGEISVDEAISIIKKK